jgi:5-carboxymethyl-2-hydroxymuconate isomerase
VPHLVILYTRNLEHELRADALCRTLADTMIALRDDKGRAVFPVAGTRVFAIAAPHFAVADGSADHGFVYFNLRMGRGRSESVKRAAGEALTAAARAHLAPLLATRGVGLTLQVDEGDEAFDAKFGNLHALFAPSR